MILITVHPDERRPALLNAVDLVLAVGESPERTIRAFCEAVGEGRPELSPTTLEPLEVLAWRRRSNDLPVRVRCIPPRSERRRHSPQVCRGQPGPGAELPLPRPGGQTQPSGPEPEPVPPARRRRQRRDLDVPPPAGRLLGVVPHAASRTQSWPKRPNRSSSSRDVTPADSRAAIREAVERRYTLPSEPAEYAKAEEAE